MPATTRSQSTDPSTAREFQGGSAPDLGPKLAPDDQLHFVEHHRPGLPAGDYRIEVQQTVGLASGQSHSFDTQQEFSILGERFELSPDAIHLRFPPPRSHGDFSHLLPHLVLERSTLPWERSAEQGNTQTDTAPPWLALLVFAADELAGRTGQPAPKLVDLGGQVTTLGAIRGGSADPYFPALHEEAGQHDDDRVTVLDVDRDLLLKVLPQGDDLGYLAHVRTLEPNTLGEVGSERAVVVANRLPKPDERAVVHLVSLENRYVKKKPDGTLSFQVEGTPKKVRLVSLASWDFFCRDPKKTFKGLLEHLNRRSTAVSGDGTAADPTADSLPWNQDSATFRLPIPTATAAAASYLKAGFVPLPHHLRGGGHTVSWYHGPMVPADPLRRSRGGQGPRMLPAATADELVIFDPESGLFDVSYAAAWQLGRLLTLEHQRIALRLLRFKQRHAQELRRLRQRIDEDFHLPLHPPTGAASTPAGDPDAPPEEVRRWLEDLTLLRHLPFGYLVPHDDLLPAESLRFFEVDPQWVECLRDGAFSIGRVLAGDRQRDAEHHERFAPAPRITGLILRSRVVADFPGLRLEGYDGRASPGKVNINTATELELSFKPGVGPRIARRIVRYRQSLRQQNPGRPPFSKPEDLLPIRGIRRRSLERMRPYITVDGPTTMTEPHRAFVPPTELIQLRPAERLGRDVLICLFAGDVHTVGLHLLPETLHFGFDRADDDPSRLVKKLRRIDGQQIDKQIGDSAVEPATRRVRLGQLAGEIVTALGTDAPPLVASEPGVVIDPSRANGGVFALQMVAGVEKVFFFREPFPTAQGGN